LVQEREVERLKFKVVSHIAHCIRLSVSALLKYCTGREMHLVSVHVDFRHRVVSRVDIVAAALLVKLHLCRVRLPVGERVEEFGIY
jgi:hypothetical protein